MIRIVDLSNWNGSANFTQLKQAGIAAVIHKASEGVDFQDPLYVQRRAEAKVTGMLFGAYHMMRPDADPVEQMDFYLSVVGKAVPVDLKLALDCELPTKTPPATVAARYHRAAEYLHGKVGYEPLVYTYPNYAKAGYCATLGNDPLWFAHYSADSWSSVPIPQPWHRIVLWQEGQRQVSGASAGDGPGVDVDVAPSLGPLLVEDDVSAKDVWVFPIDDGTQGGSAALEARQMLRQVHAAVMGLKAHVADALASAGVNVTPDVAAKVADELAKRLAS